MIVLLLTAAFFQRGIADIITLIAVGRNASCSAPSDPRNGYASFHPFPRVGNESHWCSETKVVDLPRAERISSPLIERIEDRLKEQRGEYSCAALSFRSLPTFVWIETDPREIKTLSVFSGCSFPYDCLDSLAVVNRSHWKIVPSTFVEHDHQPVQGRFWLTNTRLLPQAINAAKYYHCVVDRKEMCSQNPLAVDANRPLRRPSMTTGTCEPRNRTICAQRIMGNKTDDFCPSLSSVQPVMNDSATYGCRQRVADLICRFLFNHDLNRETCYLDKLTACEVSWKILDEKYHTLWFWPRCDDLPSSRSVKVVVTSQNRTVHHRPCQPWRSQCPIEHNFLPQIYPILTNVVDRCVSINRYPAVCIDSMATIDWRSSRWSNKMDRCPADGGIITRSPFPRNETHVQEKEVSPSASSSWAIWLLVCAVIGLVTILLLKTCARKPKAAIELAAPASGDSRPLDDRHWLRRNDLYYLTRSGEYGGAAVDAPLDLIRPLAAGHHGTVYLGRLEGEHVAVKVLKRADGDDGAYAMFAHEGWALGQIGVHEHIVKLLAVRSDPVDCLVLEFMPCCDLKNMLRYCNNETIDGLDAVRYDRSSLSVFDLFSIMIQALNGAAFIAEQGWIHRDLAARNCLVGRGLVVKIGDFGLCRRANAAGCFLAESSGEVAVRWAAPEVLLDRRYSFASDVWAAAVLVWEIFTMGQMPFYGLSASEVSDVVLRGQRLNKPDLCPDRVWSLVTDCFAANEQLRPTLPRLIQSLL
uniref:receptor protein-tyrosine kinase n=1 Tax=Plectus sambesii TaxID=2011161 RepID=A0A914VGE4_9BILA